MHVPADQPDGSTDTARDDRAQRTHAAVYQFLARRNRGENITVEEFSAGYPDLTPDLSLALEAGLRQLRQVMDAERAAPSVSNSSDDTRAKSVPEQSPPELRRPIVRGYRIVQELNAGAQGMVYEAIQESTGRTVALKVVSGFTRNSVTRFEREARALAGLSHPGVVSIIDRGRTAEDAYFLVMEYVRGEDLDKWVDSQPRNAETQHQIVVMFSKIARAIEAAHSQGIIHRDLKPSNIRIDVHGQPRIVDFGLAQLVGESREFAARQLTVTGNIIGSIPWASPEQAAGETQKLSAASDIYSLGVLLYRSLTNRSPYSVEGPLYQVTQRICKAPPIAPRNIPDPPFGSIDDGLSEILLRCLEKDPAKRFDSGTSLAVALNAYLAGSFRPRRRQSVGKKIAVFLAMLYSVAFVIWLAHHAENKESAPSIISLPKFTNSIGMQFVEIPGGRFKMGSAINEPGHQDNEREHVVRLSRPFFIACTEVTRGQYRRVMDSLPSDAGDGANDLPIDHVSWNDARNFCEKLQAIDGRKYRLPTEAEWEYACRAGTLTPFTWMGHVEDIAWFSSNSDKRLHPVASKVSNQWGLFDMQGNAAEWVLDHYVSNLGSAESEDPFRNNSAGVGIVRGGNVFFDSEACRSACRSPLPFLRAEQGVGFRVVSGSKLDSGK
jgi:serine/threonine protein kinase